MLLEMAGHMKKTFLKKILKIESVCNITEKKVFHRLHEMLLTYFTRLFMPFCYFSASNKYFLIIK